MTLAGNLTFENGESVSNATDVTYLQQMYDGALVLKNSNATDGTAKIELFLITLTMLEMAMR